MKPESGLYGHGPTVYLPSLLGNTRGSVGHKGVEMGLSQGCGFFVQARVIPLCCLSTDSGLSRNVCFRQAHTLLSQGQALDFSA